MPVEFALSARADTFDSYLFAASNYSAYARSVSLTPAQAGILTRTFVRALKAAQALFRVAPQVPTIETSAYPLMFHLLKGPHRVSDLADATYCDVSVASRAVRSLLSNGLVTKEGDPADRRATLVTLTDHGRRELETTMRLRSEFMARVLRDWSPDDAATFTALLDRFAHDLEQVITTGPPPADQPEPSPNPARRSPHE